MLNVPDDQHWLHTAAASGTIHCEGESNLHIKPDIHIFIDGLFIRNSLELSCPFFTQLDPLNEKNQSIGPQNQKGTEPCSALGWWHGLRGRNGCVVSLLGSCALASKRTSSGSRYWPSRGLGTVAPEKILNAVDGFGFKDNLIRDQGRSDLILF